MPHLHRSTPFRALSYTWVENKDARYLQIQANSTASPNATGSSSREADGRTAMAATFGLLRITPSLEDALRHLRLPARLSEPVMLWVDQICIDQRNIAEKNAQVAAMKDIYNRADEVLIWVGLSTPGSDWLIDRIQAVGPVFRQPFPIEVPHQFINEVLTLLLVESGPNKVGSESRSQAEAKISKEIRAWFRRPWFTRVWVLQEFAHARRALFMCGTQFVESRLFMKAIIPLSAYQPATLQPVFERPGSNSEGIEEPLLRFHSSLENPFGSLWQLRRRCQTGQDRISKLPLCEVVQEMYDFQRPQMLATDPRDRIYALLSLSADSDHLGIAPDYSDSVTTDRLYTKTAHAMLKSGAEGIQLLRMVQFPKEILNDQAAAERLPSWVPDFSRQASIAQPLNFRECCMPRQGRHSEPAFFPPATIAFWG